MIRRPTLCVLGMHRSGSSLVMHLLAQHGVGVGKRLIGRSRFNTGGHYEDRRIVRANKKLLLHFGGTWDRPPTLPAGWLASPWVLELRRELTRELTRELEARETEEDGPFGFKDPRSSLLIPFWRETFANLRFVVVVRNRDEVVRSLLNRQRAWESPRYLAFRCARFCYHSFQGAYEPIRPIEEAQAAELWSHYYRQIVAELSVQDEVFALDYGTLLRRPEETVRSLVTWVWGESREVETGLVKASSNALNHPIGRQADAVLAALGCRDT